MSDDQLPSWRQTPTKRSIADFVAAVTDPDSADFVAEPDRVAVFDNDDTLWTEQPMYAQLAFALDRAAELGQPVSLEQLHAGGMPALVDLVKLTHCRDHHRGVRHRVPTIAGLGPAPTVRPPVPGDGLSADAGAARPARL
jgi:hypothetical protein